jgi:hypothetical protein
MQKDIVRYLSPQPAGLGPSIVDRGAWQALQDTEWGRSMIAHAEEALCTPLPELTDDMYLEFSRTGSRRGWDGVHHKYLRRLCHLVFAECLGDAGRFLAGIEETIVSECALRTWVMPAHDRQLENFSGERIYIDLGSATEAWDMAVIDQLLGDRLQARTRALLRSEIERRIFAPYRAARAAPAPPPGMDWLTVTNNWNAVCIAGVTGAALGLIDDAAERARYIKAAWDGTVHFLDGFSSDGYCSEGVGYWNFGFGHYLLLAETVFRATGGHVDFLAREGVAAPAQFGARIVIAGHEAPAFADCQPGTIPAQWMLEMLSRRFDLPARANSNDGQVVKFGHLYLRLIQLFPTEVDGRVTPEALRDDCACRTWFGEAGVYIGRPADGTSCRMAVAWKGGNNNEHHNHNDIGSYVVVVDDVPVLLDVGGEVYTARTFSPRRYESAVLNSYGHPVPQIDGHLQLTGAAARGDVLESSFEEREDTITFDIRSAYALKGLENLTRTFTYSRRDDGSLTVADAMRATRPVAFETALMTFGEWEHVSDNIIVVRKADTAVRVEIGTNGQPCDVVAEELQEHIHGPLQPVRIAVRLREKVSEADVRIHITPV